MHSSISFYINNELIHFPKSYESSLVHILNCNSLKWRSTEISPSSSVLDSLYCCNPYVYQNKVFTIRHPIGRNYVVRNRTISPLFTPKRDQSGPNANVVNIYELDFNPSLKTLCCIKVIQCKLPFHELPRILLNELKRYVQ
ncbi:hypothetical protein CHUAL_014025 [Chamberlinius hualienensis]